MNNKISRYSDIIDLPHHRSVRRPHMSVYNRAAQFAPFAALVGHYEMVQDTADYRLLDQRIILSEDEKVILDRKLQMLLQNIELQQEFTLVYYDEQTNKIGGSYVMHSGKMKTIEKYPPTIIFMDGKKVRVEDIVKINSDIIENDLL